MIRINLLPEEYRRKARTPLKLMLAVSAVVTVNASLLAWASWLAVGVTTAVESELAVLQTEDDGLQPQVAYHKSLESESEQHTLREETLGEINDRRISWTQKLDQFVDVVNGGDNGDRHMVWFDSMAVQQDGTGAKGVGKIDAPGHSGSDNFGQVANFLDDITQSPFLEGFDAPAPPAGSESITDDKLVPAVVWGFPLKIQMKPAGVEQ
jgi:Tfp pilus assembly protein PilN